MWTEREVKGSKERLRVSVHVEFECAWSEPSNSLYDCFSLS